MNDTPRYKYLTKSYVKWLGLRRRSLPLTPVAGYVSEDAAKPEMALPQRYVSFEGRRYIESLDGKSFDLEGVTVAIP